MLDLGKGHPHSSYLPLQQLLQDAQQAHVINGSAVNEEESLQYGDEQGSMRFRKALFALMREDRPSLQEERFVKRVIQTNGCSQGIDLICSRLTEPGDVVLVETPSYFLVKDIFRQHGLVPHRIPVNQGETGNTESQGSMDLRKLEDLLERQEIRPQLLYTVPVCNNPMGFSLSRECADNLIRLANRFHFKIVADEVYLLLQFAATKKLPVASLFDRPGASDCVISINSFSKILGPGIRLGWIEANEEIIHTLMHSGFVQSGGGTNPFAASLVSAYIESGNQQEHIHHLRTEYQERYSALCLALKKYLGATEEPPCVVLQDSCRQTCYVPVEGGFFMWLRFASKLCIDSTLLLQQARVADKPVTFISGKRFLVDQENDSLEPPFARQGIRLCFAYLDREDLQEAVKRLKYVIDQYQPSEAP